MAKNKFYSLKNILKLDATYNIIIGMKSNGKSYAVHEYMIEQYYKFGIQSAYIRRWDTDIIGKRASQVFKNQTTLNDRGYINIEKITNGEWSNIVYYAGKWYFSRTNEKGEIEKDDEPFCFAFAINMVDHDSSVAFPRIKILMFDEFLPKGGVYLEKEFTLFMYLVNNIVRTRKDAKIFLCGNTLTKFCPYFREMGLKNIKKMKPGDVDLYRYGNEKLTVAVEFTESNPSKESNFYFAFDNPRLRLMSDNVWDLAIYPHLPVEYERKDIVFTYFIIFDNEILQCEIINKETGTFTYIHRKTTPLQNEKKDLIYSPEYNYLPNWRRKINRPQTELEKRIAWYFANDKVFYQDNEIGDLVKNYLMFCGMIRED